MSTVPVRRTLRTTRTTAKDNENAHARPSRISSRAKPLSSVSQNVVLKAKSIGDAKEAPAGKRKREVLTEVTSLVTNNASRPVREKGKDAASKKFDGVVISKAKPASRQPLRTIASTRQNVVKVHHDLENVKEEPEVVTVHDDHAMVISPPVERTRITRQKNRSSAQPSRILLHPNDDAEDHRVVKRQRTSSEAPEVPVDTQSAEAEIQRDEDAEADGFEDVPFEFEPEADPDGNEWDDLDADDGDDPLMVNEYVVEIFQHLKDIEALTMPNPNYMQTHKELSWRMRGILLDWLISVHARCRLNSETFHLCTNIMDRFMSLRVCSLVKFQLVGITCMFIAAKYEETYGTYTEAQMFQAERYILKTLDYNLNHPNPMHFLRRISKADDFNVRVRTLGKYLLEIGCMEWRLLAAPPSLLAAAAMWLARLALHMEDWTPNLAHYSTYSQSEIIPTANLMLNYILKPIRHEQFYKKFARKQNMKASVYLRTWALDRWPEGSQVELQAVLPELKAAIREQRAADELAKEEAVVNAQLLARKS
ncbi:g2/mitotic-specific cyclin cdc13 [Desarmillaria tabescens]|uniref:G2/mitotic-specific cyclin cdc13 n=1 Tax=Armillaria tabescens TaxID=1929756 RepID=A0AA39MU27_ARMTA|nr:g2/mitotic-specific cyclin cdc13 [Desarmillaria tabescens]KAK0446044.1 g2/mitotic-specific cyclin cdc13 [Desarmillaria tabescens]